MPPSGGFPLFQKDGRRFPMPPQDEFDMKIMRIPSIISLLFLIGAILYSPASAEMKKVDEAELARTNAPMSGSASIKNRNTDAKGNVIRVETEPAIIIADKGISPLSMSGQKAMEGGSLNLNISGQETWQFNFGGFNANYYGGITGVKTR